MKTTYEYNKMRNGYWLITNGVKINFTLSLARAKKWKKGEI